jgi:hypothetical protein
MPKTAPRDRSNAWFDRPEVAFRSKLRAIRAVPLTKGNGREVGGGPGRSAALFGVVRRARSPDCFKTLGLRA